MKNAMKVLMTGLFALSLAACGNNDSTGTTVTTGLGTTGSCAAGYVYSTMYGCLPQSTCSAGYGLYNGQCVYLSSATTMTCPAGYIQSGATCVIATTTSTNSCQGACMAGYVSTVWGCLPQGSCGACFGYANRYCLGGAPTGYLWYLSPY